MAHIPLKTSLTSAPERKEWWTDSKQAYEHLAPKRARYSAASDSRDEAEALRMSYRSTGSGSRAPHRDLQSAVALPPTSRSLAHNVDLPCTLTRRMPCYDVQPWHPMGATDRSH